MKSYSYVQLVFNVSGKGDGDAMDSIHPNIE